MGELQDQVVEFIEIALAELKGFAQPRDMAQLSELLLDAKEAEDAEQLRAVERQAKALRAFCESRRNSGASTPPKKR